jgi:hypothetical protein
MYQCDPLTVAPTAPGPVSPLKFLPIVFQPLWQFKAYYDFAWKGPRVKWK